METHAEYHAQNPLPIFGVIFGRPADVIEPPMDYPKDVPKSVQPAPREPKKIKPTLDATKKVRAANLKKRVEKFKPMAKKGWMCCEDIALLVSSTPDCTRQKLERLVESGNIERKTESRKHVLYRWVSSSTKLQKD